MTEIDTLRRQVEEARSEIVASFTMAAHIETLLAAHRALVVAELAGERDAETLEKAVDAAAHSVTGDGDSYREVVAIELRAAAPLLTAPLAAKLAQAEAERDRYVGLYNDAFRERGVAVLALSDTEARVASLEAALGKYRAHMMTLIDIAGEGASPSPSYDFKPRAEQAAQDGQTLLGGPV